MVTNQPTKQHLPTFDDKWSLKLKRGINLLLLPLQCLTRRHLIPKTYYICSANKMIWIKWSVYINMIQVFPLATLQIPSVIEFLSLESSQLCNSVRRHYFADQSSYSWDDVPEGISLQVTVCGHLVGASGASSRSREGGRQRVNSRTLERDGWRLSTCRKLPLL
jgi:hypothetical protein